MQKACRDSKGWRSGVAPAFLALAVLLAGCGQQGAGPASGTTPETAPGPQPPAPDPQPPAPVPINTATGWSDSPFISRDGQRLYFMYSRYNFGPWILSGGAQAPVLAGPDRPGLHHSEIPFEESDIYMATHKPDGSWSEPVNMGFNGEHGDSSGMEINGGNTFVWLRGNGATKDIVMANRNADGSWGPPIGPGAGINDHSPGVVQDNPHLSPDGNSLWFVSSRAGGFGLRDIWFSTRTGGNWSTPVNLGPAVNSAGEEDQPWVSPITGDIYWNGPTGIMRCPSFGATCSGPPQRVAIPGCQFAAEPSMPDDGQSLYFACSDHATGQVRIMYSLRQADGSWGTATPVD